MAESNEDMRSKFIALAWKAGFLFLVMFAYLSVGALIFSAIEYHARKSDLEEAVEELEENRAQLLKVLWAGALAKSEDDWTLFANERMDLYESELVEFVQKEHVDVTNPEESSNPWSLQGSFFYCFTIITTIGYGNVAPTTAAGKIATIIYGLIGIPMTLYLLSVIGKFLTVSLKFSIRQLSSDLVSDVSEDFNFGTPIIILLLSFYFGLGAALFGYIEEWDWLDAGYFSFITFTTVGLGDIVPVNLEAAILTTVFIFTALSLFSLIFNVFQQLAEFHLDNFYAYCTRRTSSDSNSKNLGGKIQNTSTHSKNGNKSTGESEIGKFSHIPVYQTSTFAAKNAHETASHNSEEVEDVEIEEDHT